ncbi:hypothetical protein V5799_004860 [Amblyomma americanum]|uniref:Uncharacterized protein n=1 Tax=Amblyomma americanum TaxID=6943 RepID=A0AAQ4D4W5_AMBAM
MADLVCIAIPARLIKVFPSAGWSESTTAVSRRKISVCGDLSHFETDMAAASLGQSEGSLAPRRVTQYVVQQTCVPRCLERFRTCVTRDFAEWHNGGVICAYRQCT